MNRNLFKESNPSRVVIKIGSSLLEEGEDFLRRLREDILFLRARGTQVVLVSSGAVLRGKEVLQLYNIPPGKVSTTSKRQAISALGQNHLMSCYEKLMREKGIPSAQVLLTASDFRNRRSCANIEQTLNELLNLGALPVINENDTIAVEELMFGENDILSSACATLIHADYLLILTSSEGFLMDEKRQEMIEKIEKKHWVAAEGPSGPGKGGMKSKLKAAFLSNLSGCICAILHGGKEKPIQRLFNAEDIGTVIFCPQKKALSTKKKWMLFAPLQGKVIVDLGAQEALLERGASLLPVGIKSISGNFFPHEIILIEGMSGRPLGRGLAAYGYNDLLAMLSMDPNELQKNKAYWRGKELIHRNNMVLGFDDMGKL